MHTSLATKVCIDVSWRSTKRLHIGSDEAVMHELSTQTHCKY